MLAVILGIERITRTAGEGYGLAILLATLSLLIAILALEVLHRRRQSRHAAQAFGESHREICAVLESITDGFYALDRDWRFTYINAQAERYFSCSRQALLGKNIWEGNPRLADSVVERQFRKAIAEGTTIVFEVPPPISRSWLEVHAYPCSEGLSVYFRDISDHKNTEIALREHEAMLAHAQQIANVGSWEMNLQTGQILCSDQVYRILGLTPSQLQPGQDGALSRIHPDDQAPLVRAMRRTFTDGKPCHVEMRIVRPDGTLRCVLAQTERLDDADGKPARLIGTILDITERTQIEQQLRELNDTLEQRVTERTAEAEQRTAQLRTLTSELTLAEQRERRRLAQILHDHLQQLLVGATFSIVALRNRSQDVELLASLHQVSELLDQSIKVSRSLTVEISPPVLYDGGLAVAMQWLASWMQEKYDLKVDVQADDSADPEAEDIRVLLFQAVRELLFNIVKHAGINRATLQTDRLDGDRIRIVVADEGVGFVEPARQSLHGIHASGLGLLSIRERLEILGGTLEIDSAPGQGTRAVLIAPLTPTAQPQDPPVANLLTGTAARDAAARAVAAERPEAAQVAGQVRVLLVDDHKMMREGLLRLLQLYPDIEVVGEASDGAVAVELARRTHPDVILMDVTMPHMGGVEATRRITHELPSVRVIGLSMHIEADMADRMRKAGAVHYLSKSADPDTVIEAIRGPAAGDSPGSCPATA